MDRKITGPKRALKRERRTPERLGDFLNGFVRETGAVQKRMGELFYLKQLWCRLMGERISIISSPYRVKDKVLLVAVHDPMWIAELPYIKEDMLAKLAAEGLELSDIKFTVSKVYKNIAPAPEPLKPVSAEMERWARRLSKMISDPRVRTAYFNALMAQLGRRGL